MHQIKDKREMGAKGQTEEMARREECGKGSRDSSTLGLCVHLTERSSYMVA